MHKFTNTLTPAQVYRSAIDSCQPYLRFRTAGKVTGEVILSVLFAAAARISSIHETCGRLAKAPCEETFTAALYNSSMSNGFDGGSTPPSPAICPGPCDDVGTGPSRWPST